MSVKGEKDMNNNTVPYALQMAMALLEGNFDGAHSIIKDCITVMSNELAGVASGYDLADYPFMVAALKLTATSLEALLDENGRGIADKIVASSTCITIDADELKRQAKEEE